MTTKSLQRSSYQLLSHCVQLVFLIHDIQLCVIRSRFHGGKCHRVKVYLQYIVFCDRKILTFGADDDATTPLVDPITFAICSFRKKCIMQSTTKHLFQPIASQMNRYELMAVLKHHALSCKAGHFQYVVQTKTHILPRLLGNNQFWEDTGFD